MNSTDASKPLATRTGFDARSVETRNVTGSTAGAGSGDFHVYRQERRREQDRLTSLKLEAITAAEIEEDMRRKADADARTVRRAARRRRKKDLALVRRKRAKAAKVIAKRNGRVSKANGTN